MSQGSQAKRPWRVSPGLVLALLGLLAALARLPLIHSAVDVSPDGCEYLGIARHFATEGRWVSSLKWHFFSEGPVVHPALADRPPLYPLWAAAWVALSDDPETQVWLARSGNLVLASALPAVLFWALRAAVRPAAAAWAAGIFLVYPAFLRYSCQPLTETLFLLIQFGSLGLFLRANSCGAWWGAGSLAGLAFLTRPSGILLPALYTAVLLCRRDLGGGKRWPAATFVLAGFLLPLLPYFAGVAIQTGSPFTSVLRYNYSIGHIDEGTLNGFERAFPSPVAFVTGQPGEVARLVAEQWRTMGSALLRSLQFLLPLALFWRRGLGWQRWVLLGLAALNFFFHAMSWTVWGAARYMFPSFILGMALLLDASLRWASLEQAGRRRLAWGSLGVAVGLTLAACVEQDVRLYRQKKEPYAGVELGWAYTAAAERLRRTEPGDVCAANQPWIINLLAGRPAVIAPRFRDAAQLRRYLSRYQPSTLTLFLTERRPADTRAALVLVDDLWQRPRLRPGLGGLLMLEFWRVQPGPRFREAMLVFRIRTGGKAQSPIR